jgi:amidohydrolase
MTERIRDLSEPVAPFPEFPERLAAETAAKERTDRYPDSAYSGAPGELVRALEANVDALAEEIVGVSHDIHDHPEVAFEEHHAVETLVGHLAEHGIAAKTGAFGVDTAFLAEFGSDDGPRIGIISEYDALPGIGHGCGHNVMAAAGLGAVLALKKLQDEHPDSVPGRIIYFGAPAEEGHSGKEYMARGGAFTPGSLDACLMVHSFGGYDVANQVWLGRRVLTVDFRGVAAHASSAPFMGRNALDAAALVYQAIGLLRQQMAPVDRIHAIITKGGTRQSIITEDAQMKFYVRAKYPGMLKDLSRRLENIVEGAALMTDTGVDIRWDEHPATLPLRSNSALEGRYVAAERRRGRDPLPLGVVSELFAASTDFGNVSYRVPGIHPLIQVAGADAELHTRAMAEAGDKPPADRGAVDGAYGLAQTALDVLWDRELLAAVHREFEDDGGAVDVEHFFD